MIIANIAVLLLFVSYFIFSLSMPKEWMKQIDRKEHKLYFLYPLANDFLIRTRIYEYLQRRKEIHEAMKALYVTNKAELLQKLYWCNKVAMVFLILTVFSFLSLVWQLGSVSDSILQEGKYLTRPEAGEGSLEAELKVTLEDISDEEEREPVRSEEMTITVEERKYTEAEVYTFLTESAEYLKKAVLGNNKSAYNLHEPLNFMPDIPGTGVTVEWKPEDYNIIHSDGTIGCETLTEPTSTSVIATLSCQKQVKDVCLSFLVMPGEDKKTENLPELLQGEIHKSADRTADRIRLELPTTLKHYQLRWSEKKGDMGMWILLFGIMVALLLWMLMDQELERKMKLRKQQMMLDYPEIINKFTLLVNAGMTIKQAWLRITEDYSARSGKISKGKNEKRYAYEEMLVTANELRLGGSENTAYEQYGRRIGLIPYIKFGSLITQNLKKGNKGFTELLKQEAMEAFEERKETAKRLGEEAGTKLLMPMMLMLVIVFMIILIPAFISFRI